MTDKEENPGGNSNNKSTTVRQSLLTKFPVTTLILECIIIVFGVLFALTVNNWAEKRNQADKARAVLMRISGELETNHDVISLRLDLHDSIYTTLQAAVHDFFYIDDKGRPKLTDADLRPSRQNIGVTAQGGLALEPVSVIAWQAALTADVLSDIDYDLLYALSRAYTALEDLPRFELALADALRQVDQAWIGEALPVVAFATFESNMLDLRVRERYAKKYMAEVLALLSERGIALPDANSD